MPSAMPHTRFEKARIIGARALQLAMGAPPLIRISGNKRPLDVAQEEFNKGLVPITVIKET
jgi:DNA-directed RNA polymerase subunit K/omega